MIAYGFQQTANVSNLGVEDCAAVSNHSPSNHHSAKCVRGLIEDWRAANTSDTLKSGVAELGYRLPQGRIVRQA